MHQHPVVTADFPENLSGGIMICGYNFGFSAQDQKNEENGVEAPEAELSFFSDSRVNNTLFRNRLLKWFDSWGSELETDASKIGSYERSFFQTNWIATQTATIADDNISNARLVAEADGILSLIASREPRLILFTGSKLIEALNDSEVREQVERILGTRPGNAKIYQSEVPVKGTKFKLLRQDFPNAVVVSTPHVTGTRGISDEYMAGFRRIMQDVLS